jgi:hypothetical protein
MNAFLSPPSSLSEGEVAVLFWAVVGGFIVFGGLAIEKFADWLNERFLAPPLKPHSNLEFIGWCILMFGIAIEIGVAGWSANDAWQTRQMAIKNDPLNQPIASATARVFLIESGTNTTGFNPNMPNFTFAGFVRLYLVSSKQPTNGIRLICKTFNNFIGGNGGYSSGPNNYWELEYGQDVNPVSEYGFGPLPNVRAANACDEVFLSAPFIPPNTEVLGGHVTVTINSVVREFEIPPQTILTSALKKPIPPVTVYLFPSFPRP